MELYTDTINGVTVKLRAAYCGDFVVAQVIVKGRLVEETGAFTDPDKAMKEAWRLVRNLEAN